VGDADPVQDRYAGDVGDFQTLGLLRALSGADRDLLRLGVCWYLTEDEWTNGDGRHVRYLEAGNQIGRSLERCDADLYRSLRELVWSSRRSVAALEASTTLPQGTVTYAKRLAPAMSTEERCAWHSGALTMLRPADLVFLDPDNGVVRRLGTKGHKYALLDEVADYAARGQSVVVYQHASRKPGGLPVEVERRLRDLASASGVDPLGAMVLRRGSARFFMVVAQPAHGDVLRRRLEAFAEAWRHHGELLRWRGVLHDR
jgi:hypothetical protein